MNYTNELKKIGFSQQEALIYLACLELDGAKASEISKKTGIPRTSIYTTIKTLLKKDYLKKIKREKIDKFIAKNPNEVFNECKENIDSFSKIIPNLEKMVSFSQTNTRVEFSETKEGLVNIYKQILKADNKHPVCLIESGKAVEKIYNIVGWDFIYEWQNKFYEKNISVKGMMTKDLPNVLLKTPEKIKKIFLKRATPSKIIETEDFNFSINLYLIYPDTVYFIIPDNLSVISVKNKNIYESLKSIFDNMFEKIKYTNIKEIIY